MIEDIIFLIGRILFGIVITFFGINHFLKVDSMEQYASYKGVPMPRLAVLGSGLLLIIGGLSIGTGLYPTVGIITLVIFFAGVTPKMHDFWNADPENRTSEMTNFLKNMAILGAVLILAVTLPMDWSFSL